MKPRICALRQVWIASLSLLCLLAISKSGIAQETGVQDLTSLSIEELMQVKIVTASRHLEDPRKAPSPVTIITRDEIVRYGWRTLAEVLRSARGFYTANDRNYSYLGVRGFLQSGDFNARYLLLINGHRVNENVYDSAQIGTEFPLDLDLIERVEIVCGPSSSMFGTNAVLAVINVITRSPGKPSSIEIAGSSGSFLSRNGRITAIFKNGGYSGLVSGTMYRSQGVSRLYYPEFDAPDSNNGIAQNLDGDSYTQSFIDLQRGQLRVQGLYSRRLKVVPTAPYGTIFNDPANRSLDTRGYVDASYHWHLSPKTDLDVRGYYDAYRFWASYPYGTGNLSDRTVEIDEATADWSGGEVAVGHKFGRHRFVVGLNAEYNFRVDQKNYDIPGATILNDHRKPWLIAEFGELELNLPHHLTVNAGGRIDHYNLFGTAISPRIAFIYLPNSKTSLKYIFGHSFRAPNAYDSYYLDKIDVAAPSADLDPEDFESHVLVLDRRLTPWLALTVDGFFNDLDDAIVDQMDPDTGQRHFVNGNGLRGRGVDIELDAATKSGWAARTSYTYVTGHERITDRNLINSPSHLAKFNGTLPISSYGALGLEILYTGAQKNYLGSNTSSSLLTNATLSTQPLWGGWQFSFSSYNLFDRKWYTPIGPELVQPAVQQDGRAYRFKVSYRLPLHSVWSKK